MEGLMQALEQLAAFLDKRNHPYTPSPDDFAIYTDLRRGGLKYEVYCCEEKYGWLVVTCPVHFARLKKTIPSEHEFHSTVHSMCGGRTFVLRQGKAFYIIGKVRPEHDRIEVELDDYAWACSKLVPALQLMASNGKWNPAWEQLLFDTDVAGHG